MVSFRIDFGNIPVISSANEAKLERMIVSYGVPSEHKHLQPIHAFAHFFIIAEINSIFELPSGIDI